MRENLYKKGLIIGVIILFFGASVVPSISGYSLKESDGNN